MPGPNPPFLIIGGTYAEKCSFPRSNEVYGSGLRAASVLGGTADHPVVFRTMAASEFEKHARIKAVTFNFSVDVIPAAVSYSFHYLHTLAGGALSPKTTSPVARITGSAKCALVFGMVEGLPTVHADTVVYDPQAPSAPQPFASAGSTAKRLAVVLNRREATGSGGNANLADAARSIMARDRAEVVVIKDGPRGALVCDDNGTSWIPVFQTARCFLIGSGDVFTAVFAREWALTGKSAGDAALDASLAAATWCGTGVLPLATSETAKSVRQWTYSPGRVAPRVYLAGPFFSPAQVWWVTHTRSVLQDLGLSVFSPYHDVGVGCFTNSEVARKDLEGLRECDVVFALLDGLDPGTLFEIGAARTKGIPVVGLRTEGGLGLHETMLEGTGCALFDDFGSAAYHAYWMAMARAEG